MSQKIHPHLGKAPITEALVDIYVNQNERFKLVQLENPGEFIISKYPESEKRNYIDGRLHIGKEQSVSHSVHHGIQGYLFKSDDKKRIVQFRRDGFTFNQLAPYQDWETFIHNAKLAWMEYVKIVNPQKVSRIVLRYINQISLPLPVQDLKKYIKTYPGFPESQDRSLHALLLRLNLKYDDGMEATIAHATEPGMDQKSIFYIIDNQCLENMQRQPSDLYLWERLNEFRNRKNDLFFDVLTEKTISLLR